MKLVKKEQKQTSDIRRQTSDKTKQTSTAKDICYLHNCPKVHDGRPCPMTVIAKEGESVICPICGTHVADGKGGSRKVLYWTDPMIPGFKSDKPGKSPMGMDLVPVYETPEGAEGIEAPAGYAPVLVSPQKQQLIGITTAVAQRHPLITTIRAVGTVAHDPELYQTQAEYLQALRTLMEAQASGNAEVVSQTTRLVEASQLRLRHLGLSDELVQELAGLDAPEHGLLVTTPGEPVWVYAQVYEYERPLLAVGQAAHVEATALPGTVFAGVIRSIDPRVDPMTRTTRIRVRVEDPEGRLSPEMYVNASLRIDAGERLAVPEEAVFDTGTRRIVFVDKGQGLFEPRDVTVGVKAEGFSEITSGVAEGERVVTSGNFLVDSESRLKAALEGMGSGGGHQHGQ
jgi:multidrug efflux pump subunit AcrA (membrane-fusion protein)